MRFDRVVLVDTNVILEAIRTGSFRALSGAYQIETVDKCIEETQTGTQFRKRNIPVDIDELQNSLQKIHTPTSFERAKLSIDLGGLSLDEGEFMLWAHAYSRNDVWKLCGPDKASLRCGVRLGLSDRLISLEKLLKVISFRPKTVLKKAYTTNWHESTMAQILLDEKFKQA